MAYYPGHPNGLSTATGSFPQTTDCSETIINDIQVEYASNGAVRMRRRNPTPIRQFIVNHILPKTQKEAFASFYETNRNEMLELYYVPTATAYSRCIFANPPQYEILVGDYWRVSVELSEI